MPVRFGDQMLSSQEVGVLRLVADDGLVGLGEVAGPRLPTGVETELERVTRTLLGREAAECR